jgi:acyl-coenzyme A synthetase/AMP-(fatty) acid ligase
VHTTVVRSASALVDAALAADAASPALHHGSATITYGELGRLVDARAGQLDIGRRGVVVLSGPNVPEFVVTYLAALRAGHVVLLGGDHSGALAAAWSADVVATATGDGVRLEHVDQRPRALHPDLALLLSTSGSTGSPKLVRLSHANLVANARSISQYLQITDSDCAITSLPLHYCYGLSVLHSHLVSGGRLVLTDASVVDPCFREAVAEHGVTNVAGVPHTFAMLDRAGVDTLPTGTLRLLTQAGGRMEPAQVSRWLERAERWGAEFVVMYGQTEATARMAYLPPTIARRRPEAIGLAIPGGELTLRPVDGQPDGVGELVYRGPNVMMGYAVTADDLALGATVDELATGDLARYHADDGVFEIVGRRTRFVKPFGLRVDLDRVEQTLAASLGAEVAATGDDRQIVVMSPAATPHRLRREFAELTGLPPTGVISLTGPIPRTASGKADYPAVAALAAGSADGRDVDDGRTSLPDRADDAAAIAWVYADVLGRAPVEPDDSFLSLGGDSLSYVECAVRLEPVIGRLPTDWHTLTVRELAAQARPRSRRVHVDTTVVYRALAVCLIVATHMRLWFWPGGAHLLLAVVGFNVARFLAPIEPTRARVLAGLRTAARVAVPAVAWIAVGMAAVGAYSAGTLLLVNNYVGPASHRDDHWRFWFIEVFVHLIVLTTVVLAIPAVRRWERRWQYGFPLAALLLALLLRLEVFQMGDFYNMRFRTHGVLWFFLLGWLVQRSTTTRQRALTTVLCIVTAPHFFGYVPREVFIAGALVLLVWCRAVPLPRWLVRPVGTIAAASMWIYISHFTFWPVLVDRFPIGVAYVVTLIAGVAVWAAAEVVEDGLRWSWARRSRMIPRRRILAADVLRAG